MFTYIIKSQGFYKIGRASNIKKRLSAYKTHNPSFELIKKIEGDYESSLHFLFLKKHSHLEWFNLNQDDINSIDKKLPELSKTIDGKKRFISSILDNVQDITPHVTILSTGKNRKRIADLSDIGINMWIYVLNNIEGNLVTINKVKYKNERCKSDTTFYKALYELIDTNLLNRTNDKEVFEVDNTVIYKKQ